MPTSQLVRRFRAVAIAVMVTMTTNYAISYAERSGSSNTLPTETPRPTLTESRSGSSNTLPTETPRPEVI